MSKNRIPSYQIDPAKTNYQKALLATLDPHFSPQILQYKHPQERYKVPYRFLKTCHYIPSKRLDAPKVLDDFYQHNLHWGKRMLALNLNKVCHLWNTDHEPQIFFFHSNELRALKWTTKGEDLAVGDAEYKIIVKNVETNKNRLQTQISTQNNFSNSQHDYPGIGLSWRTDNELTASAAQEIQHFDVRTPTLAWKLTTETYKTCSLEWSPSENLLARGDDDNRVTVYDMRMNNQLINYRHKAAVKALKWMPNSTCLLSGGGINDRLLKVYNVSKKELQCEANLGSQITSIDHLKDEIFTIGLGISRKDNIQIWNYNADVERLEMLHSYDNQRGRILGLSKDPNSSNFSSLASSETLMIWKPKLIEWQAKPSAFEAPRLR